ncbi:hypothetical protein BDEG_23874 [Batrachochytrium dendrobatidis JEL423]|uniref:Cytochrome P450 n=1 Tax=Batrachochytrium dendrobatidis (strain JEL423) TaxID=403673 RepID=A0A177WL36_BATDL|nr:hypothetical protein BDEG_23874 [Batrachochytrium dendrobatidis JEL423]
MFTTIMSVIPFTMPSISLYFGFMEKKYCPSVYLIAPVLVCFGLACWRHLSKPLNGLPGPYAWPIVGQFPILLMFLKNHQTHLYLAAMRKKYGPIWILPSLGIDSVVVCDAKAVQSIFQNSTDIIRPDSGFRAAKSLFQYALFILPGGPLWKKHRKLLQSSFSLPHLRLAVHASKETAAVISTVINNFIQADSSKSCIIDIHCYMISLSLDIIGKVAFKYEFNAVKQTVSGNNEKGYKLFEKLLVLLQKRVLLPKIFWSYANIADNSPALRETADYMRLTVKKVIDERDASCESELSKDPLHMDVLERLLNSRTGDLVLSEEEIISEIIGFIIAGYDTTASTMTFIIFQLCIHPEIQTKLVTDICEIYSKLDKDIDMENIMHFEYLDWVIKEAQRLDSVLQNVMRVSTNDIQLMGYEFKAGTQFMLRIADIHRDERYWKDPLRFNPDRWAEPCVPGTFLPFGDGAFKCIGQKMAMVEIKVVMIHLLREFQFELVPNQKLERFTSITHGFKKGLMVKISKRK